MINALFSSRSGGTKKFVYDRTNFGWGAIEASSEYIMCAVLIINFSVYNTVGYVFA